MSKEKSCPAKFTSIGGQALIEGVMMRGPKKTAMAVRHAETKEIQMKQWENGASRKGFFWKTPFIRGVFNFVDSLVQGYKALMLSVDMSGMGDEEVENEKNEKEVKKLSDGPLFAVLMVISCALGVAMGVGLFIWLPIQIYNILKGWIPALDNRFLQSFCEGLLRIIIFIAYISATALMKDIRRVYQYHGAEHKTIFCYEHGLPLTVENVKKQIRFHPRCGTSFMILMLLIGIFFSMIIPHNIPSLLRAGIKILMIPIVMGVGYEAIKLAGRKDNKFTRFISAPGLWVQRITTREPEDDMIECAIASFVEVLPLDDKARTTAQTVLWTPYEEPKKDEETASETEETTES